MDILNKPISTNTFQDIVDFCKEGEREGFELDYKQDLPPGGLSKHFASFSNTRGGLIIIGVEEDRIGGIPKNWVGIKADAKSIERIHQWASNVTPIPRYEVHATDTQKGNFFILVRILEGDRTPYYVQNDGNLWVRTGNISNPIDIASPDSAELLFGRKEKAELARANYLRRAQEVYDAGLRDAERERKKRIAAEHEEYKRKEASGQIDPAAFAGGGFRSRYYNMELGVNSILCIITVQPFYPRGALLRPDEIKNQTQQIRDGDGTFSNMYVPDLNVDPIPEGVLSFDWGEDDGAIDCQQLYSAGLVYLSRTIVRTERDTDRRVIYLSHVVNYLFQVLKAATNFYKLANFQGGVRGSVILKGIEGIPLIRTLHSNYPNWPSDSNTALLSDYEIQIDTDTTILNGNNKFQEYFLNLVREIYWAVGYADISDDQIKAFLKYQKWLIE